MDSEHSDSGPSPSFAPGSLAEAFRTNLQTRCAKLGFSFSELRDHPPPQIQIDFSCDFPMWIRIDMDTDANTALLVGVVRTYGLAGDRTDYHDLISLLWASLLRSLNEASVRLIDIPHPAIPGELWGRYILFEKQPAASYISLENPNYELIERLLLVSSVAARDFSLLYQSSGGDPDKEKCYGGKQWAQEVAKRLKWKVGHRDELTNERRNPNWCFYRRNDCGVTAFRFQVSVLSMLRRGQTALRRNTVGGGGMLLGQDKCPEKYRRQAGIS